MDVLPATIAANTIALQRGANILRVHDVAAAKQTIQITELTQNT
jgi:dihydropteroate synthase